MSLSFAQFVCPNIGKEGHINEIVAVDNSHLLGKAGLDGYVEGSLFTILTREVIESGAVEYTLRDSRGKIVHAYSESEWLYNAEAWIAYKRNVSDWLLRLKQENADEFEREANDWRRQYQKIAVALGRRKLDGSGSSLPLFKQ